MSAGSAAAASRDTPYRLLGHAWESIRDSGVWAAPSVDYNAAFIAGSGLTAVGQIGNVARGVAVALALMLALWVILGEFRAWGAARGDSFGLATTIVRGGAIALAVAVLISAIT